MKKNIIIIIVSAILVLGIGGYLVFAKMIDNKKLTTYDVTFETSGGTLIESQTVTEGEVVVKPTDPIKEGYVFVQWLYQGITYDFSNPVNSNLLLTADWVEKKENIETFLVTFNSEGGTTIPNQIIEKGNKIQKPEDPTKEGYKFKGWVLNETEYNFETIVENNIELKALWEKIEIKNDKPVNNISTNKPNNGGTSNNSNNISSTITLSTPILTEDGRGGGPVSFGITYEITDIDIADGIEIYKSSNGNNYQLEKTLTKTQLSSQNNIIETMAYIAEHNYYKVRAYKTVNGKKVYSEYSRIVEVTGPILSTPILTEDGRGGGPVSFGITYEITDIDIADGIEIYKSSNGNNYQLEKTLTKTQLSSQNNIIETMAYIAEHNYYKVRAYKTVNGKKVYSEYSRIVEVTGPILSTPILTEDGRGGGPESFGITYEITDIDIADGIEIYKSSNGNNYQLEKTLTKTQLSSQNNIIETMAYIAEHNYYKVRAYKTVNGKKVYSEYSRIVEVTGPTL